ncbi:MAG TPA: hypothetical protein VMW69_07170 [Spirochaetia bacterium]|nr:hypothetical protein [Spirochaetia bacterium]
MCTTNLLNIEDNLACTVFVASPSPGEVVVRDVVASDLMSDVLAADASEFILVTSLVSEQVVYTADIVGAAAILFVNDKRPHLETVALAEKRKIPLLSTKDTFFECCLALGELLGRQHV